MRSTLLALAFLLPAAAGAQELRSGPNAPSTSSQPTPQRLPGDRAGPPSDSSTPRDVTTRRNDDPARTAPPPGHQTMPAPGTPGASQPGTSTGYAQPANPTPPRPGARPDASTTGRDVPGQRSSGSGR